jgi:hypothetical protein
MSTYLLDYLSYHRKCCFIAYLVNQELKSIQSTLKLKEILTINVPVVFMALYVMVLRGATSFLGALERVGPENGDFLGPEMSRANAPSIDVAHLKTIKYNRHKNNRYIGNFMYMIVAV